jgi:hypothetical protein
LRDAGDRNTPPDERRRPDHPPTVFHTHARAESHTTWATSLAGPSPVMGRVINVSPDYSEKFKPSTPPKIGHIGSPKVYSKTKPEFYGHIWPAQ